MKIVDLCGIITLFLFSCSSHKEKTGSENPVVTNSNQNPAQPVFFPVTTYIKGQVYEIKNGNINPLKFVTSNNRVDSSWVKVENFDNEIIDFLSPEIDSVNLVSLFSETKFLDQTLDAITFTYDPLKTLPDTFPLLHWDVYIDPNSGKVKQVYILKKLPGNKMQQLRWIGGKSCTIKTVTNDVNGTPAIEREVTLKWSF
jgi:hypothetical protein